MPQRFLEILVVCSLPFWLDVIFTTPSHYLAVKNQDGTEGFHIQVNIASKFNQNNFRKVILAAIIRFCAKVSDLRAIKKVRVALYTIAERLSGIGLAGPRHWHLCCVL